MDATNLHHALRRGRQARLAAALLLTTMLPLGQSAWAEPWPTRHHDAARTGRAGGVGDIQEPAVFWRLGLGEGVPVATVLVEDLDQDGELEYVSLVDSALVARDLGHNVLWDTPPLGLNARFETVGDFDGDGNKEILLLGGQPILVDGVTGEVVWRLSPDDPAQLSFRGGFGIAMNVDADPELELLYGFVGDVNQRRFRLYDFSNGFDAVTRTWENADTTDLPVNVLRAVVGDFDGDGQARELAMVNQTFCRAVFININTGARLRTTANLAQGRYCYGLTQAVNVDGDAADELVFTGATAASNGSTSVTVYDYPSNAIQWQYEYGVNLASRFSLAPAGAVEDLDGDGALELVISVYDNQTEANNQRQDGLSLPNQWSVAIYDAATGQTLGSIPNAQAAGFFDVDGDGEPELLTRSTLPNSTDLPEDGALAFWTLGAQREPVQKGLLTQAAPVLQLAPHPPGMTSRDYNLVPSGFSPDGGAEQLLYVLGADADGVAQVNLGSLNDQGQLDVSGTFEVPGGNAVRQNYATPAGGAAPISVLRDTLGDFVIFGPGLQQLDQLRLSGHVSETFTAPLLQGEGLQILFDDSASNVVAVTPNANPLLAPTEVWAAERRDSGDILAFDRDGDGVWEVALVGREADQTPFLALYDGQGNELWHQTLQASNLPFSLVDGRFGGDASRDLALLMTQTDGTAVTVSFNGDDGAALSTHAAVIAEVNATPNRELLVLGDQNNDGLDELLLVHNTTYERLNGANLARIGAVGRYPNATSNPSRSALLLDGAAPGLYVKPFAGQLFVANPNAGAVRWSATQPTSLLNYQAPNAGFADANGDGLFDIAVPGLLGDLTVYSSVDGQVLYRRCLRDGAVTTLAAAATIQNCSPIAPLSSVVSGDVDGDGEDDFLVGDAGGWLYAIQASDGSLTWSLPLQARAFFPALTDLDEDGDLEILVSTSRSELLLVDNAALEPVAQVREVALDGNTILDAATDIDTSARADALGVVWEASPGADHYLVRLVTGNGTEILPAANLGDVTQAVFTGLSLVPGTSYRVEVTAVSGILGAAPTVSSDGVLIQGGPPAVNNLRATPTRFRPLLGETVNLSGNISAAGITPLSRVNLTLTDSAGVVALEQSFSPNRNTFFLDVDWTGLDGNDQPYAVGTVTARVEATDLYNQTTTATVRFELASPEPPAIEVFVANPTLFVPEDGETTTLGAQISLAYTPPTPYAVSLTITNAQGEVVAQSADMGAEADYELSYLWDGLLNGQAVAPGEYTATLTVVETFNTASATTTVTVALAPPPVVELVTAAPDAFNPILNQSTTLSGTARSSSNATLTSVVVEVLDENQAPIYAQTFGELTGQTYEASAVWTGTLQDGNPAPVGEYTVRVSATDSYGHTGEGLGSVQVINPGAPLIEGLALSANSFIPEEAETVEISAQISAESPLVLPLVLVEIVGGNGEAVLEEVFLPDTQSYALLLTWDALVEGLPLAAGVYTVTVTASDSFGQTSMASISVEVREALPPVIEGVVANPDPFDPAAGEVTTVTGTARSQSARDLLTVGVEIRDEAQAVVFSRPELVANAPTYELAVEWDGRDPQGALVAPGVYGITVTTVDGHQRTASAQGQVTVAEPVVEPDTDAGEDADTGDDADVDADVDADAGDDADVDADAPDEDADVDADVPDEDADADADVDAEQDADVDAEQDADADVDAEQDADTDAEQDAPDMEQDAEEDAQADVDTDTPEVPDVQGGGGSDCDCATPSKPTSGAPGALALGLVGAAALVLRRRRR